MRAYEWLQTRGLAQRGQLFCWIPVCIGIGIGVYFQLHQEPHLIAFVILALVVVSLLIASRFVSDAFAPLLIGLVLIGCGVGLAKLRTEAVSAPVLGFRYYGPIEGRIVGLDRSSSDAIRLTLDHVVLSRMSPARTPQKIRVSLHGGWSLPPLRSGDVVATTGHLGPPSGPAEPDGFDFQRHAWFLQIGAVGYTRNPLIRLQAADGNAGWRLKIYQARIAMSHAVQAQITGDAGAFAAAIMTGDRSAMSQQTIQTLRMTNLAHLLAISGLHMGLLTGFVFAFVRLGFSLWPAVALRIATKKLAAVIALAVGAAYLALSGGSVATERAYIMVAVMLVAVILDRRALTLRAVAMAATIVMLRHPEAIVGPGFQMSFAATTALVVVFRAVSRLDQSRWPKWLRAILSVVLSSAVAGLATAPFAAAHFNQIAHFGLIANLLTVPLMGAIIMPAAVLAVFLAPFGGWAIGLWCVDIGLRWILYVAGEVAAWDGAVGHVIAPSPMVLPLLALGLLWCVLWKGRGRVAGVAVVGAAFAIWSVTPRPAVLIADDGTLVGVMGPEGRVLSKGKGSGFVADIWLENDGAPVPQAQAAARQGIEVQNRIAKFSLGSHAIIATTGKTALAAIDGCEGADILISNQPVTDPRPCRVIDITALRQSGAIALDLTAEGALQITTARGQAGNRPWVLHGGQGDKLRNRSE